MFDIIPRRKAGTCYFECKMPPIVYNFNSGILEVDKKIVLEDLEKIVDLLGLEIIVVGDKEKIKSEQWERLEKKVSLAHAPNTIYMDEKPTEVLKKPDNSTMIAKSILASTKGAVLVDTGNTGAVGVAVSWNGGLIHPLIKKIPAYCNFPIYYEGHRPALCDVGSKTDVKPKDLLGYAVLLIEELKQLGITDPGIALLNIGTEKGKGINFYKETYDLFERAGLPNFAGNAEARQVYFDPKINGFIFDGFVGNQVLKMAEATYEFMQAIDKKMGKDPEKIKEKDRYIGLETAAILLGTKHKVILGHGGIRPLPALLKASQHLLREINSEQVYDTIEHYKNFLG
ncbi:hypothetical protein KY306_00270 [Candidatus Woesearchaeota archaeon]|nr:hypothetical protein [Candidatus Woesearchaeota archaeon]